MILLKYLISGQKPQIFLVKDLKTNLKKACADKLLVCYGKILFYSWDPMKNFESFLKKEKIFLYFLESLLSQVLWVAGKWIAPYD